MHQPAARARNKVHPQSREHRMKYREHRQRQNNQPTPLPCDIENIVCQVGHSSATVRRPSNETTRNRRLAAAVTKWYTSQKGESTKLTVHPQSRKHRIHYMFMQIIWSDRLWGCSVAKCALQQAPKNITTTKWEGPKSPTKTPPKSLKKVLFLKPA